MPEMPGMDTRACKRKAEEAGINDPRIRSANAVSSLSDNNKSVSRREYELMKQTPMQRVADLDAKMNFHQEELNWKDAILRHKNEQLDGKDQRIHILENNLNNERARKEKLKEEIRQQQKDIKEQDEKLKRRDQTIVHQRRMIDTYTDQNDSLREQNSEIRNDLQKLASRWA